VDAADERLSQSRIIQTEEKTRQKSENSRRAAMNISVANMRPRPELATTAVQLQLIRATLSAVKTTADCTRAIGMCELAGSVGCLQQLGTADKLFDMSVLKPFFTLLLYLCCSNNIWHY
jgi:hypothetical protein